MFTSTFARKVIILITSVLFFVGYYYILGTPIGVIREIRIVSISALLGLCIFGSIVLLADIRKIRAGKIFAFQMLLVGCSAGFTLIQIIFEESTTISPLPAHIVTPGALLYGNSFAFVMLLYPFERLSLQRMTLWDYAKLVLPALLCGLGLYVYLLLAQEQLTEVKHWREVYENIYRFDVWFRIVLLVYPVWLFSRILYQKRCYVKWNSRNFSNADCVDLGWLDYYLFGYFIILCSYLVVVLTGIRQGMLVHSLVFLLFFGFICYNILRRKTPGLSESGAEGNSEVPTAEICSDCSPSDSIAIEAVDDKYRFVDKIPHYKVDLERWMQEQKPYKNKDFKLLDVMHVLPLNRSYISRLFNEGYGETFFDFVMRYRLEESVRLLEQHAEMNIRHISDLCGFSSPSVFGRAFLKNKGVTPKQYRRDMDIEI